MCKEKCAAGVLVVVCISVWWVGFFVCVVLFFTYTCGVA